MTPTAPQDWIARQGRWTRGLIGFGAGAVMTMGHAPVDLPWGFFVAVPVLVWLMAGSSTWRQAAWAGWAVGFGYFLTGLHWIGHAFLVDAEAFAWLLPFALTLLPGGLALFWALGFGVSWVFRPIGPVGQVLVLAACMTLVEYLRGNILTGFPWALPGYVWVETPLLQSASWAGPFGLTLICLVLTGLPLVAALQRRLWPCAAAIAGFALLWGWGITRVPDQVAYAPDAPVIRVVQPNAPQHLKWHPEHVPIFYRRLLRHTSAPAETASGQPDLVIWPETAVNFVPAEQDALRVQIATAANGAPVILGALHVERSGGERIWLNSMVTIMPDGSLGPRYDKHHLVPFGEYMPFKEVFELVGLRGLAQHGGASFGPGPAALQIGDLPRFAAAICYEMIFPSEIVAPGPRPEWILTITNDAWFGGFAGPQQHLAQARFRAVEQGLPVARAANTGISTIIDSYGRMSDKLNLHKDGYVDERLPAALSPTIYSHTYTAPTLLACMLILFAAGWSEYLRMRIDNT
ncbi:MAG: apolipoprotein N-acyltransferase [Pseudomonadota bacterium]